MQKFHWNSDGEVQRLKTTNSGVCMLGWLGIIPCQLNNVQGQQLLQKVLALFLFKNFRIALRLNVGNNTWNLTYTHPINSLFNLVQIHSK